MNLYVFDRDGNSTDKFNQEVNECVDLHKEQLRVIDYLVGHDRNGYIQTITIKWHGI